MQVNHKLSAKWPLQSNRIVYKLMLEESLFFEGDGALVQYSETEYSG